MNTLYKKTLGLVIVIMFCHWMAKSQDIRRINDFNGIKAGDSFIIQLSQSDTNSVVINAPNNITPQINTEIKEGILIISTEGYIKGEEKIFLGISVKSLASIDISGAAEVKSKNQLLCKKLYITTDGAGDINLDLKADEITTTIKGSGNVTLTGSTRTLDVRASGAGDLNASDLEATKIIAKVSGPGDAKVNVIQSLTADISGTGSVIYKGNPIDRNITITGEGSVRESISGTGEETASDVTPSDPQTNQNIIIGEEPDNPEYAAFQQDSTKKYNNAFKHWNGLEVGINGYFNSAHSINLSGNASFLELNYAKSIQFGINLLEKDFHLNKNKFNIVLGFGFDFNHYAFENDITLNSDTAYLSATYDTSINYKKDKLNVTYIKIPLLFEYNTSTNPKNNFHIAIGVEFAYRIGTVAKQKYFQDGKKYKIYQHDDFNLQPFRYSAVLRVGYDFVTLYLDYGLNQLFKPNEAPKVYPFTLGLTVAF